MGPAQQRVEKEYTVELSTGRWWVLSTAIRGITLPEAGGFKGIVYVDADLPPFQHLEVAAHEAMHASNLKLSEKTVTRVAKDVAEVLWAMGYRIQQPAPCPWLHLHRIEAERRAKDEEKKRRAH